MANPRIGPPLGSGAARGWSHIGIIEALTEAGILPKLVSPASPSPGYFDVLMTSINVMQDQITRARLDGAPAVT